MSHFQQYKKLKSQSLNDKIDGFKVKTATAIIGTQSTPPPTTTTRYLKLSY